MPTLHILGSGAGLSSPDRGTTMLAVEHDERSILIDCGGDAIRRAAKVGLDIENIDGLIITHEHPDHVSGFPLLIERLWLAGRRKSIPVYGPTAAIEQAKRCFYAFTLKDWPNMVPIEWIEIPFEPDTRLLSSDVWDITCSPTKHPVDTIGIRIVHRPTGRVVAYSCDTAPSANVARLAANADILVHEATEFELSTSVHTSMADAARIAAEAEVTRLVLVHLPAGASEEHLIEARSLFPNVEFASDYDAYPFHA